MCNDFIDKLHKNTEKKKKKKLVNYAQCQLLKIDKLSVDTTLLNVIKLLK